MQGYFIKVGDSKQGPFLSKAAAAAEAKVLKEKGYDVKVVQQAVSESAMMEALGNPEAEVELEAEDELDFDAIFGDDDEGDDDESSKGGDEGDDEGDEDGDGDGDGDDDDEPGDDDEDDDEDEAPTGVHGWFKSWGNS